jgi:hypothetical protein
LINQPEGECCGRLPNFGGPVGTVGNSWRWHQQWRHAGQSRPTRRGTAQKTVSYNYRIIYTAVYLYDKDSYSIVLVLVISNQIIETVVHSTYSVRKGTVHIIVPLLCTPLFTVFRWVPWLQRGAGKGSEMAIPDPMTVTGHDL